MCDLVEIRNSQFPLFIQDRYQCWQVVSLDKIRSPANELPIAGCADQVTRPEGIHRDTGASFMHRVLHLRQ